MSDAHVENNKSKLLVEAIAPGQAINIIRMFKFLSKNNQLTVGFNLRSGNLGKKDIIWISDVERDANARFKISTENGKVFMKCRYCERVFEREVVLEYNGLEVK